MGASADAGPRWCSSALVVTLAYSLIIAEPELDASEIVVDLPPLVKERRKGGRCCEDESHPFNLHGWWRHPRATAFLRGLEVFAMEEVLTNPSRGLEGIDTRRRWSTSVHGACKLIFVSNKLDTNLLTFFGGSWGWTNGGDGRRGADDG